MNTITVVIADDHEVYREGLYTILHDVQGIKIIDDASNGLDLVSKVSKHQPDIVLTDITMPIKNGIAATKEIIALYPATGVIALSVSNEDSNIVDMLEAGALGYLLKNSTKEEIIEAIQVVYKQGSYYCRSTSNQLTRIIVKSRFNPYQNTKQPLLSELELKIIKLLCEEKTSKEIAKEVFCSVRTIESWRLKIQKKLNVHGTAGIVIYAVKTGIYVINK